MPAEGVQSVKSAKKISQNQYKDFVKERLVERIKPIPDLIKRNKISPFSRAPLKVVQKSNPKSPSWKKITRYFHCFILHVKRMMEIPRTFSGMNISLHYHRYHDTAN